MTKGRIFRALGALGLALGMGLTAAIPGRSQPPDTSEHDDFYRGKLISLYIGFTVGGGCDVY